MGNFNSFVYEKVNDNDKDWVKDNDKDNEKHDEVVHLLISHPVRRTLAINIF